MDHDHNPFSKHDPFTRSMEAIMFEAENGFSESTSIYGDDDEVVFESEEYPFEDQTMRFIEIFYHDDYDDYDADDDEADFM